MLKLVRISGQTTVLSGGKFTLSLKIPGDFNGFDYTQPSFQGRDIKIAEAFFASPSAGDYCTSLDLVDVDGIIGAPGTTLSTWADSAVDPSNQGAYMPTNIPKTITPPRQAIVPSGLYINVTFQKATATADTIYVNLIWDDLS